MKQEKSSSVSQRFHDPVTRQPGSAASRGRGWRGGNPFRFASTGRWFLWQLSAVQMALRNFLKSDGFGEWALNGREAVKRPNGKCVKMWSRVSKSSCRGQAWRLDPVAPDQVWAQGGSLRLLDCRGGELARPRRRRGRGVRAGGGPPRVPGTTRCHFWSVQGPVAVKQRPGVSSSGWLLSRGAEGCVCCVWGSPSWRIELLEERRSPAVLRQAEQTEEGQMHPSVSGRAHWERQRAVLGGERERLV